MIIRLFAVLAVLSNASGSRAECDRDIASGKADNLRANLTREAERLRSWRVTWTAIFAGGTIGQVGLAGLFEGDDRRTFDVGAVKAALGAVTTPFLSPRFDVPPKLAGESACEDLVRLRAALAEAARKEAKGVAWFQHFPGVAVNVAGILYLGLAHGLWVESLLGAAFGTAVGETKIWTQPRRAIDWAEGSVPTGDAPWISRLRIGGGPLHLSLSIDF